MMQNRSLSRFFRQWVSVYEDAKQVLRAGSFFIIARFYRDLNLNKNLIFIVANIRFVLLDICK